MPAKGSSQMIQGWASRQAVARSRDSKKNAEAVPVRAATRVVKMNHLPR